MDHQPQLLGSAKAPMTEMSMNLSVNLERAHHLDLTLHSEIC